MSQTLQRPSPEAESQAGPIGTSDRSGFERFLDNFFREENIKWMSVIGAAIVLGSSLMLVSHQWKSWPPEFKYLAILGYTLGAYVCAQLAKFKFGLRTTAGVLHLLTLLLMPLCFTALSWLEPGERVWWHVAKSIGLMVPAVAFMRYASFRIFDDLLRGRQATFAYSYLLLSMASALPPMADQSLGCVFAAVCWLVMSVGVMKVNRHIFWMTEEYQQPRVFAFFPIALLGAQFLMLVAMKSLQVIPYEWLGMGCVMLSATVLLTARTVAEVFKQRTGDLVRPLPWNLVMPLVVGLILLALGVVVSFYGFSFRGPTTFAVVPTALVAGALLCVVAWDTRLSGFVWAGLVLLTVAYQTSPTLVAGLVQQLKQHAASAVNESSLPLAFYGITYLPWIVALMLASRCCSNLSRRGAYERLHVFSAPARQFATLLTIALFALAAFNLKAVAIVSILDVPLLLGMAVVFRDRRYAYAGLASLVLASALLVPLVNAMGWAMVSPWHTLTVMATLALALVAVPGIDRGLLRIPMPASRTNTQTTLAICMITGYVLALGLSVGWTVNVLAEWPQVPARVMIQLVLLLSTLLVVTVRTRDYSSGINFWLLAIVGAMVALARLELPWSVLVSSCSIGTAVVSLVGYFAIQWMRRQRPAMTWTSLRGSSATRYAIRTRALDADSIAEPRAELSGQAQVAATLVVSLGDLSLAIAACLAALYHIPALAITNFTTESLANPLATSVMVVWGIAIAKIFRSRTAGAIVATAIPLWFWAVLATCAEGALSVSGTLSFPVQTFVWMLAAGGTALGASMRTGRDRQAIVAVSQTWVAVLTVLSLFNADPMFRVVGMLGLAIGCWLNWKRLDRMPVTVVAILANLHLMILVLSLCGIEGWFHQWLLSPQLPAAMIMLLPVFGLSTLLFDMRSVPLDRDLCIVWAACLRNLTLGAIIVAFALGDSLVGSMPAVLLGLALVAIAEFTQAVRQQMEANVWLGLAVFSAAGLWLLRVGVLEMGIGISQVGLVTASAVGLLLAHLLAGHTRYAIFVRPMLYIGLACPALLTGMAIVRELSNPATVIDPLNTLTMFAAAAVYFHQGLVRKERRYVLLAVAIINVALGLTWRSLHIYDAQAYCIPAGLSIIAIVQLLKRELPKSAHDPLRYMGALVMLVSPMFAIVGGSWLHLLTLLALSVCVILLAIGLRLRALVHTGTAFLLADLVMMVVRSSIDHPSLLWICGLGLGGGVIVLAAICERHREQVLGRIRMLTAELATWN